jgi:hypothetical protein
MRLDLAALERDLLHHLEWFIADTIEHGERGTPAITGATSFTPESRLWTHWASVRWKGSAAPR